MYITYERKCYTIFLSELIFNVVFFYKLIFNVVNLEINLTHKVYI